MAQRIGILGGSFNPIHIGHVRIAIEVIERLGLDRIDFVPASQPPHKRNTGLLPFALRKRLVELAIAETPPGAETPPQEDLPPIPGFAVNDLEAQREGPSYTIDTLAAYNQQEPDAELFFILGAADLAALPSWQRGLELIFMANLVLARRPGGETNMIKQFVAERWSNIATKVKAPKGADLAWQFNLKEQKQERMLIHLPISRLDISSNMIREKWLAGRSIRGLVPFAVERELFRLRYAVNTAWGAPKEHLHELRPASQQA